MVCGVCVCVCVRERECVQSRTCMRVCLNNIFFFLEGLGLLQIMLVYWFGKGKTQCGIFLEC